MLSNLTPYITPVELVNGGTGLDWNAIPSRGASAPSLTAEQVQLCWRVTDRMDELAEQVLRSQVTTEQQRGPDFWLTADSNTGEGRFKTARWPILGVLSGKWSYAATYPPSWTTIAADQFQVDDISGYLAGIGPGGSGAGVAEIKIAPGIIDWFNGRNGYRVSLTYVPGWPNCGITASVAKPDGPVAGDTSIHVDDICGWGVYAAAQGGLAGRVFDASSTEGVVVTSVTPDTPNSDNGPGLLQLSAALVAAHGLGVRVSAMPSTLQQAALYLATVYGRIRGVTAIAPQRGGSTIIASKSTEELEIRAEEIIGRYARII